MPSVYSFETNSRPLADALSRFFKLNGIQYERSGCFTGYYFSIEATPDEVDRIDNYIDSVELAFA